MNSPAGIHPARDPIRLLAALLSALAADYFLTTPRYSLYMDNPADIYALSLFVLVATAFSAICESRLRSQRRIVASERRYAVTLASIGDAVIATDTEARVTFLNPAAESLTGWPLADAVGRPLAEVFRIINEQTRQPVEDPAAKVLRLDTLVGLANHTTLVARDGRETPIDDCGAPILEDSGRIAGVVLVFRDVTQRRRAEEAEALRRASERMELALRGSNVCVWEIEMPDGDFLRSRLHQVNLWEQLGFAPHPPAGIEPTQERIHPDDRASLTEAMRAYLAGETAEFEREIRFSHSDGSIRIMFARGVAVRDAVGKPIRVLGTGVDITGLKHAEEALAYERFLLHTLMDHVPDQIYFKDRESRFVRINKSQAEILGLADPCQAVGKTDFDFFAEEHARAAYEDEQQIIRTGQPLVGKEEKETYGEGRAALGFLNQDALSRQRREADRHVWRFPRHYGNQAGGGIATRQRVAFSRPGPELLGHSQPFRCGGHGSVSLPRG